jgi:hypothetical protein
VGFTGNCDEAATWSTTPPGGQLSAARALRASFGDFVLSPGQTAALTWTMTTPADTPVGAVAWNSFAYVADRLDPREPLEASEPAKVGVRVVGQQGGQVGIRFVKLINGQAAPDPPGLIVTEGDRLVFSYQVTNTGTVPLSQLAVVDDVLGSVPCPRTSLDPGESMTCVAPPQVAIAGQHTNIGTVLGLPMTDGQGQVAPLAVDPANYFADSKTQPLIGIVKRINGRHTSRPPGLDIPPGAPVTFTYEVRNGGALPLVDVRVADDKLTGVTCDDVSLRPHTTTTCTAPVQTAIEGSYANEATATAQPTDPAGNPVGPTVSATDRAYYTNTLSVTGGRTGPMVVTGAVLLVAGAGLVSLTRPRAGRDRRAAPG